MKKLLILIRLKKLVSNTYDLQSEPTNNTNYNSDFVIRQDNLPFHIKQYRTNCNGESPLNFYGIRATKNDIIGF